jgi:hypothetical protein
MAYIGNSPALKYASFAVQHFTTSATTGYTLDNAVTNENGIALFVNNVRQQPGASYAYTVSGTTLTLSAATTSSDTMYCVFIGKAVQTVNPPAGSVAASQLATDAVTTVKILDTAVTGAKLNDDAISGQGALGEAPADTDEFLVSDAGTLKRVDYSYIKGITQTSFLPTANPLIINGNMAVAQRGTSVAGPATGTYPCADRIKWHNASDAVVTISQATDVPTGGGFATSFKVDVTTADASVGAAQGIWIQYSLEGQNVQVFKKGTASAEAFTVAFWVKSTKTGTFIVELYDTDNTRTCSQALTVDTTNTWEKKILNFPADTTGAFGNDNGSSLLIYLTLMAGSDYTSGSLQTTWAARDDTKRYVGQVNAMDSTSNDFLFTGLQLEVGTYTSADLPPFRHESYGDNLRRCSRYYQLLLSGAEDTDGSFLNFTSYNGAGVYSSQMYPMGEMRAAPTGITSDNTDDFKFWTASATYVSPTLSFSRIVKKGSWVFCTLTSAPTQGYSLFSAAQNSTTLCAFEAEF